uniref:Uncharacterized protein n=1 Tax=Microcebus murinus TaxID=30608 RepID=A0A8C5XEG6_MICMU
MAASAKKKNKKGKTISLTDFLAEDWGTGGGSTYVPKPVSWADETDDLEGDVSTTWHKTKTYLLSRRKQQNKISIHLSRDVFLLNLYQTHNNLYLILLL